MRVDEFDAALPLLPERLAVRVMALRQPATARSTCPACQKVRQTVDMVFAAVRHDEYAVAADWVAVAERLVWDSAGQHTEHGPWRARVRRGPQPPADDPMPTQHDTDLANDLLHFARQRRPALPRQHRDHRHLLATGMDLPTLTTESLSCAPG